MHGCYAKKISRAGSKAEPLKNVFVQLRFGNQSRIAYCPNKVSLKRVLLHNHKSTNKIHNFALNRNILHLLRFSHITILCKKVSQYYGKLDSALDIVFK